MKKVWSKRASVFGSATATTTAAASGIDPVTSEATKNRKRHIPKRVLSVLLVMLMVTSVFAVLSVPVSAKTPAEVQTWQDNQVKAKTYRYVVYDKNYNQCPSYVKYYIKNFFSQNVAHSGNGKDVAKNVAAAYPKLFYGYEKAKNGLVYQPGDVISFLPRNKGASLTYGHVAIVRSYNSKTHELKITEQYKGSGGVVTANKTVSGIKWGASGKIVGIARPRLTNSEPIVVTPVTQTVVLTYYRCNTAVSLRKSAGGAKVSSTARSTVGDVYPIDQTASVKLKDSTSSDNGKTFTWGRIKGLNQWVALSGGYFTKVTPSTVNEKWIVKTKHDVCVSPGFTYKEYNGKNIYVNADNSVQKTIVRKMTVNGKTWGGVASNDSPSGYNWIDASKCKLSNGNTIASQSIVTQAVVDDSEPVEILSITAPTVVYPGEELTIEWSNVSASNYEVKVMRLNGEPDPSDNDVGTQIYNKTGSRQTLSSSTLFKGDFSEPLQVGRWYKIQVKGNLPGSKYKQAFAYFQVVTNTPYPEAIGASYTSGNTLNVSWPSTPGALYSIKVQTLNNGLPGEDADISNEPGTVIASANNLSTAAYSFTIPPSAVGKYLKFYVEATYQGISEDAWSYSPVAVSSTPRSYTVKFLDEYENVIKTQVVAEGGNATPPYDPESDDFDYVFAGWSDSYEGIYADITFVPIYDLLPPPGSDDTVSHIVTYDFETNGGTDIDAEEVSADVDEEAAIDLTVTATKEGWNFIGWNTDPYATTALSSLAMGTEDVTLYAIFSKTLTGSFVDYNGSIKTTRTASVTIYNDAETGYVDAPVLNTYTDWNPLGWTTETSTEFEIVEDGGSPVEISDGTIYYGVYQKSITLSYNANGGSSTPPSQSETKYVNSADNTVFGNPNFELSPAISKAGSNFSGWSIDGTIYEAGQNVMLSASKTATALWNVTSYTLTLNANGGTVAPPTVTQAQGSTYTLPTPTRSGYTFNGWTLSGGGSLSGSVYTFGTSNGTVTAQWTPDAPAKGIFGTNAKWYGEWWHYLLFFLCFGFIWMWF